MMQFFNNAWTSNGPCGWLGAVLLAALVAPGFGSGCTKDHCENDSHCRTGEQCNMETNQCYTSEVDAGDAGVDAGDAEPDAGDAEPDECTGHGECTDPTKPVCIGVTCQPCNNTGLCADKDSEHPLCDNGECVQCIDGLNDCDNPTPICDANQECVLCANHQQCIDRGGPEACDGTSCVECTDSALHCAAPNPTVCDLTTNTCRPCQAHDECDYLGGTGKGVCDWDTSTCVDPTNIIYVDGSGPCASGGQGLLGDPLCEIHQALAVVSATRFTVLVENDIYTPIIVSDSGPLRLLSRTGAEIAIATTQSVIDVSGASTQLIVEGFVIRNAIGASYYGVECSSTAVVTLINNVIQSNEGGGVSATSCTVTMDGNIVHDNSGGGIRIDQSDYTITNNIVHSNGSSAQFHGGVYIAAPGTPQIFAHNTVVDNVTSGTGIPAGVRCSDPVSLVNSIIYGNENDGANNCTLADCWTSWINMDPSLDPVTRKLNGGSACIGGGQAYPSVPFDIDGESRDPATPDIGADEYYP